MRHRSLPMPRVVAGTFHTPLTYAAVQPDASFYDRFDDYATVTDYHAADPLEWDPRARRAPAVPVDPRDYLMTPQELWVGPVDDLAFTESLSGVMDLFSSTYWRDKWEQAKASFTAALTDFYNAKTTLQRAQGKVAAALSVDPNNARLQKLQRENSELLHAQTSLEVKAGQALAEIARIQQSLAAVPGLSGIAIPIAAVAGIAVAAAAIVIHTQRVKAHNKELDAVISGTLSSGQIAQIKGAGLLGGLPDMVKWGALAALGIGAVVIFMGMGRRGAAGS